MINRKYYNRKPSKKSLEDYTISNFYKNDSGVRRFICKLTLLLFKNSFKEKYKIQQDIAFINRLIFKMNSEDWLKKNQYKFNIKETSSPRDFASQKDLFILSTLENFNSYLLQNKIYKDNRYQKITDLYNKLNDLSNLK
jgi:hypothetical protein